MNAEKIIEYPQGSNLDFKLKLIKFIKLCSSRVENLCKKVIGFVDLYTFFLNISFDNTYALLDNLFGIPGWMQITLKI